MAMPDCHSGGLTPLPGPMGASSPILQASSLSLLHILMTTIQASSRRDGAHLDNISACMMLFSSKKCGITRSHSVLFSNPLSIGEKQNKRDHTFKGKEKKKRHTILEMSSKQIPQEYLSKWLPWDI